MDLNSKYSLDNYMKELSSKFDAEAFFSDLIKVLNNNSVTVINENAKILCKPASY